MTLRLPLALRIILLMLLSRTITVGADASAASRALYDWNQCQGSARPYVAPAVSPEYPDSLVPVMINHVGRHGARYAASAKSIDRLRDVLVRADSAGTITRLGRELLRLVDSIRSVEAGHWGRLDSVGVAEQEGIARRMISRYPMLFGAGHGVVARASYVPRCVTSMYAFNHQLTLDRREMDVDASSGPRYDRLLRFFDDNAQYERVMESPAMKRTLRDYERREITLDALRRVVGRDYRFASDEEGESAAMAEYQVLSGMEAIGLKSAAPRYFTLREYNRLWRVFNLKQYLAHSASQVSDVPATVAAPLLKDIIMTFDDFLAGRTDGVAVELRFGHAETLMPLLSLMCVDGCDVRTVHPDEVFEHWRDFDIVPMAANLQMVLFRSDTGRYYLRTMVNERVVGICGYPDLIPWSEARGLLTGLLAGQ